jgi:[ribosomal protein S18]-alanine N-acetyltransferase
VPPCLSGLTLQPFIPDLVAAAVALDQQCLGGLWTTAGYERELANPNSLKLALVGERVGDLVEDLVGDAPSKPAKPPQLLGMGFAWSILEEAHITLLAVESSLQGQGLGQVLLWGLLQQASKAGLERATLEVRASNQVALALYAKFGFLKAGKRRHYYDNPREDGIILWRSGLHLPETADKLAHQGQAIQRRLAERGWQIELV